MNIKQLKELIKDLPDDMEVFIDECTDYKYDHGSIWVTDVRDAFEMKAIRMVADKRIAQRACKETKDAKKCLIL